MMGTVTVFRTPDEAALELELPLLGVIPVPPDSRGPFRPAAPEDPEVAKAYDRALERVLRPTEPKGSIGVLGDVDPAQRAYASGALASALAAHRGAVLVDADLRGAHLSFDSGSRAQEGLVDVLRYGVRSPRVVAPTETAGLDLLPVGSATVDLPGTYSSDAAAPLFEELRRGRFLVVNGPGPTDVDAAAPLLRRVSSWVLLVEIGRSDAETSRRLRDALGPGRCAGVLAAAPRNAPSAAATAPPRSEAPAAPAPPPARSETPPAPAPPRREPPAAAPPPTEETPAASAPPPPPRAGEPPAPPPARTPPASRASTRDLSAAVPPPPPLPPVAVKPVKNVTPTRATARPEIKDRSGGAGGDRRGGRRIAWWIGGAALISVAIAVTLLRPESKPEPKPSPTPVASAPAGRTPDQAAPGGAPVPAPPRAEHPVAVTPPPAGEDVAEQPSTATPPATELAAEASPAEEPAPEEPAAEEPAAAAPAPVEETPPPRRQTSPPPAAAPRDFLARTVPLIAGQTVWAVHVSSFRTQDPADEEAARFRAKGFPTVFQSADIPDKGHWIRIYVGPFADRATAEEAAGRIREGVQEYTMVRRLPAGELQDGTGREGR